MLWIVFGYGITGNPVARIVTADNEDSAVSIANAQMFDVAFDRAWCQGEAWA